MPGSPPSRMTRPRPDTGRVERFEHLRELAVATDEQGPFVHLLPIERAAWGTEA